MNTNRDKAVSFGRDGGDVRRPVFLSMSQSRMLHPFQLRGSQSGISPAGCVNNDKLRRIPISLNHKPLSRIPKRKRLLPSFPCGKGRTNNNRSFWMWDHNLL